MEQHKEIDLLKTWKVLINNRNKIGLCTILTTGLAVLYCLLATPIYTASAVINPPRLTDAGTTFAQAISGISAISGGGGILQKTDADIAIKMLNTNAIRDMIIKKFNLMAAFKAKNLELARQKLAGRVQFTADLKSGFVEINVDGTDPKLATQIANYYTVALGQEINNIAFNRANQRYQFYQEQLKVALAALNKSQSELREFTEHYGILAGKQLQVVADISIQLQAQLVSAQIQLQNMGYYAGPNNPDYKQLQAKIAAVSSQLDQLNKQNSDENIEIPAKLAPKLANQYINLTRELKFRELVYEVMFKQSKAAQLDAQSELVPLSIQVIDPAQVPVYKSKPHRLKIVASGLILSLFSSCVYFMVRNRKQILVET